LHIPSTHILEYLIFAGIVIQIEIESVKTSRTGRAEIIIRPIIILLGTNTTCSACLAVVVWSATGRVFGGASITRAALLVCCVALVLSTAAGFASVSAAGCTACLGVLAAAFATATAFPAFLTGGYAAAETTVRRAVGAVVKIRTFLLSLLLGK
jgi:hypothetical protein